MSNCVFCFVPSVFVGSVLRCERCTKDDVGLNNREATPGAELAPKTMKVSDLRDELAARNLSPKGELSVCYLYRRVKNDRYSTDSLRAFGKMEKTILSSKFIVKISNITI